MRPIAEHCYQLQHSKGANGYLIHVSGRAAVVDPGMSFGFKSLLAELREAEPRVGPITDILLTHYDADHTQTASKLQEILGAAVWLGAADAGILRGDVRPPTRVRRFLSRLFPSTYPAVVTEISGEREIFPGLTAFPTPGHTPGHMAFQKGGMLFTGDAVTVSKRGELSQFIRATITDKPQAIRTESALRGRIRAGSVRWICAGHNPPVRVLTD